MNDSPVPIEEIEIGDTVLAEDPNSGEQAYQEVVSLTDHPEDELVYITIQSKNGDDITVLEVTRNHPIFVEGEGWLNAENLESGDELRTADGEAATVVTILHQ